MFQEEVDREIRELETKRGKKENAHVSLADEGVQQADMEEFGRWVEKEAVRELETARRATDRCASL